MGAPRAISKSPEVAMSSRCTTSASGYRRCTRAAMQSSLPAPRPGTLSSPAGLSTTSRCASACRKLGPAGIWLASDNLPMSTLASLPFSLQTILLLIASNIFMTMAWYGHLRNLATAPWYVAALASWGIALAEYMFQVPANRIGFQQAGLSVGQLKIMQEVITLAVFIPFAVLYLKEPLKFDYVWAALCMVGAVYFVFRSA